MILYDIEIVPDSQSYCKGVTGPTVGNGSQNCGNHPTMAFQVRFS
jgi:hypothetical protein